MTGRRLDKSPGRILSSAGRARTKWLILICEPRELASESIVSACVINYSARQKAANFEPSPRRCHKCLYAPRQWQLQTVEREIERDHCFNSLRGNAAGFWLYLCGVALFRIQIQGWMGAVIDGGWSGRRWPGGRARCREPMKNGRRHQHLLALDGARSFFLFCGRRERIKLYMRVHRAPSIYLFALTVGVGREKANAHTLYGAIIKFGGAAKCVSGRRAVNWDVNGATDAICISK